MVSCVCNIYTKINFQVTVENVRDVFLGHSVVPLRILTRVIDDDV